MATQFSFFSNPNASPNLGGSLLGGGPFNGFSPQQTMSNEKDGEQSNVRSVLVNSWNTAYATGKFNGLNRVTTPFRAVNNSGDFLARVNYACGGPNPQSANKPGYGRLIGSLPSQCDTTGVPASSCNVRFVADSSDYTTFRKQQALNKNFNDLKNGGYNNSAYTNVMHVRRF
jgi:hypothetical protein